MMGEGLRGGVFCVGGLRVYETARRVRWDQESFEGWRPESVCWNGLRFGGRVFLTEGIPVCLGRLGSGGGLATVSLRLGVVVSAEVLGGAVHFLGLALDRLDFEMEIRG